MTEDTQYNVSNIIKISNHMQETFLEIGPCRNDSKCIELRWLDEDEDVIESLTFPSALARIVAKALDKYADEIENSSKPVEVKTKEPTEPTEPYEYLGDVLGNCVDCKKGTRYWLGGHTPLCRECYLARKPTR